MNQLPPSRFFDQTSVRSSDLRRKASSLAAMGNIPGARIAISEAESIEAYRASVDQKDDQNLPGYPCGIKGGKTKELPKDLNPPMKTF